MGNIDNQLPQTAVICLAVFLCGMVDMLRADALDTWTWRYPNPQGRTLQSVTFGNGQFVAVGDNGTIVTSRDGYHWTNQTIGVFPSLLGVAYADGQYAAVGYGGVILVSSNATTWTQIPSVTGNSLNGIAGNSLWRSNGLARFLAVGNSGTVVACENGTNWTPINSITTNALRAISFANYFIIGGEGATLMLYAKEGRFLRRPLPTVAPLNSILAVTTGDNGITVAVGDLSYHWPPYEKFSNQIIYAYDPRLSWTNQMWIDVDDPWSTNFWNHSSLFVLAAIASGSNGFVAAGNIGYSSLESYHPGVVFSSPDGKNWSELPWTTSSRYIQGATYGNGLYVLVLVRVPSLFRRIWLTGLKLQVVIGRQ